jgi:hypothetical protein
LASGEGFGGSSIATLRTVFGVALDAASGSAAVVSLLTVIRSASNSGSSGAVSEGLIDVPIALADGSVSADGASLAVAVSGVALKVDADGSTLAVLASGNAGTVALG